ncbi:MAG: ATP-binding protein [Vulcanimicrobiota bacterium]
MELVATHIKTRESVRFALGEGSYTLGRATADDPDDKLAIGFDGKLSRRHARLEVQGQRVKVSRDGSRYPLYRDGRESEEFYLAPGERFSSAETLFEVEAEPAEQTICLARLGIDTANQRNAEKVLEVVLGLQPLLCGCPGEQLFVEVLALLRRLLPTATVRFLRLDEHGRPLDEGQPRPSRRLVRDCLEQREPVYHLFGSSPSDAATVVEGVGWALAAPVVGGEQRYVLYAVGREDRQDAPGERDRAALALIASVLSQHLEGRRVAHLQAQMEAERKAIQSSKLAAVGQLAAGMAHELNNPLATVKLALDYARLKAVGDETVRRRLEAANLELERAHRLVEQLLRYSREGGHRQFLCLGEMVEDTLAMVRGGFEETGLELQHRRQNEVYVEGEANELQQLLLNLLLNARQANLDHGQGLIEVRTGADEHAFLEVRDRGPGLAAEVRRRMFEPFFTTRPVGQGAGLGLTIARDIATAHGGTLEALDSSDGAIFRLTLPRATDNRSS